MSRAAEDRHVLRIKVYFPSTGDSPRRFSVERDMPSDFLSQLAATVGPLEDFVNDFAVIPKKEDLELFMKRGIAEEEQLPKGSGVPKYKLEYLDDEEEWITLGVTAAEWEEVVLRGSAGLVKMRVRSVSDDVAVPEPDGGPRQARSMGRAHAGRGRAPDVAYLEEEWGEKRRHQGRRHGRHRGRGRGHHHHRRGHGRGHGHGHGHGHGRGLGHGRGRHHRGGARGHGRGVMRRWLDEMDDADPEQPSGDPSSVERKLKRQIQRVRGKMGRLKKRQFSGRPIEKGRMAALKQRMVSLREQLQHVRQSGSGSVSGDRDRDLEMDRAEVVAKPEPPPPAPRERVDWSSGEEEEEGEEAVESRDDVRFRTAMMRLKAREQSLLDRLARVRGKMKKLMEKQTPGAGGIS